MSTDPLASFADGLPKQAPTDKPPLKPQIATPAATGCELIPTLSVMDYKPRQEWIDAALNLPQGLKQQSMETPDGRIIPVKLG
jgi:hypothetical protein